ncbi:MAG: PIN domain-containing protein [Solirubrobacteraceae bacterium]
MTAGYVVDTSIFVAVEQERAVGVPPPGQARVSVATLTELIFGVHRVEPGPARVLREETLRRARSFIAMPYDEIVAQRLGELLAAARNAQRRAGLMDAIIAATALAHDLVVWTQDDDFEVLSRLAPALRVSR